MIGSRGGHDPFIVYLPAMPEDEGCGRHTAPVAGWQCVPSDFGSSQHVSAGTRARVWRGPGHLPLPGRPTPAAASPSCGDQDVSKRWGCGPRLARGSVC